MEQILGLGWSTLVGVAVAVALTIFFGLFAARAIGLKTRFGVLTAGSVAICGASAAVAIAAVLPRHEMSERDTAFTIIAVTTLSTIAMVLYPLVGHLLHFTYAQSGVFLGGTIHDVAQVVGAGYSVSQETGDCHALRLGRDRKNRAVCPTMKGHVNQELGKWDSR
jgi:uncharacterized membrane protein YadS